MSDEELCKRLRYHREHPVTGQLVLTNPEGPEAADRIEALVTERNVLRLVIDANIEKHRSRAEDAEDALKRIANSQPRPRRDGSYEAHDVSAFHRIARTYFTKHGSQT